jgi:hypothetical protein
VTRIVVTPSRWKLPRKWKWQTSAEGKREFTLLDSALPPKGTLVEEPAANSWKVVLAWSREALEEAAYAMTYWYMAQVGCEVFSTSLDFHVAEIA